jgi:SAM-dependent methyltransferase
VLDCGGGSGSYAVPLAVAGAAVTVVDISADALATLHRRASEAGVGARVTPVQGDAELLTEAVGESEFDLVLAHGILEAVDKPAVAFAGICRALSPGGLLSVLVTNPVATVLARALAGDLRGALAEFRELDVPPARPGRVLVRELCAEHGLVIEQVHGVGVFTEWIPGAALDAPGARDALADLEKLAAVRAPFAEIATRLHLLARRPRGAS